MPAPARRRVAVVDSHPIQYHAPWYRALAEKLELTVFYAHAASARDQAAAGYGVEFEWDVDLLGGYHSVMLDNVAAEPGVQRFDGCDTPELEARLLRGRFDCVIVTGWYLKSFWQAIRTCRRAGLPILVRGDSQLGTPRGVALRAAKELGYRWLLGQFDAFLSVGTRNREYLLHYGARDEAIFPVPHFVDAERFVQQAGASDAVATRAALGASDGDFLLLFVGRLVDFKRPGDVLEALARVDGPGRFRVAYVGAGPLEGSLRALAAERGIPACFAGFRNQSELPGLYAAADALVLPSDASETWGLVVNEAMACGTPAVVSEAAGCAPDMVEPGQTGERFAVGDLDGLARALERLACNGDPDARRRALQAKNAEHSVARAVAGTLRAIEYAVGSC